MRCLRRSLNPYPGVPKNVEKAEESGKSKDKIVVIAAGAVGGARLATVVSNDEAKVEASVDAPVVDEPAEP